MAVRAAFVAACSVPGCERPYKTRGMCGAHAERERNGTPLDAPVRVPYNGPCSVNGCARKAKTRGLCGAHAERARAGRPLDAPIGRRKVPFEECFQIDQATSCWVWRGYITPDGYGAYRGAPAHRASYELAVEPIPDGLHIDHLCRNRACVNPDHLEVVTCGENSRRGIHPNYVAYRENRCTKGHPYTEANTYWNPNGTRVCRACHAARERRRQAAARGVVA